jgi:TRAP-type C4-dicarboxylate transport system substrate-binding protein
VLSRAELSRTGVVFVALLFTMAATCAFAREFRAADTQSEDYPTVQALRYMGRLIAERTGGRHQIKVFHSRQLAMAAIYARAQRDPASATLIERIRKVE